MPEYIYIIHPFREGFFDAPSSLEVAAMEEHYQYLKEAAEAGIVLLAGPCLDDTFGIVILQAENEAGAREFMLKDPSVDKNVMMAEIHPLRISIRGK